MGEGAALGPAGRTGCVDYRGQIGGLEGVDALVEDGVGHGLPAASKLIQCPVVDDENLGTVLRVRSPLVQRPHRRRLDHEELDITVMDDPLHLVSRRRFVDRNCHTATGEDGIVEQQPLKPRPRHEGNSVAGLEPTGDNALGDGPAAFVELTGGHVDEVVAVPIGGHNPARFLLGMLDHRFEQIGIWRKQIHGAT